MYRLFFLIFFINFTSFSEEIYTIEIDGSNLPNVSGEIKTGERIYKEICSNCHGFSGEGLTAPELVGDSPLQGENVSKTIGNFWPYAPKIFDYIKRSKENKDNNFFSNREVYGITGYLLKINNLYNYDYIDKEKLSNIEMPNRKGFISEYY